MKEKFEEQIKYGYARVSSTSQKEDRQIISLREQGIPEKNIYIDKISGKILTDRNITN